MGLYALLDLLFTNRINCLMNYLKVTLLAFILKWNDVWREWKQLLDT